jgi:hypothetical protein
LKLPVGEYTWVDSSSFTTQNILEMDLDGDYGYIFEVSLSYPDSLQDATYDFPLAPSSTSIKFADLSPTAKKLYRQFYPEKSENFVHTKLIGTFWPREKYCTH